MRTSETLEQISKALSEAWASFNEVQKSAHNKYDNYAYSTLEDYMDAISVALKSHGLTLLTEVEDVERLSDRQTKKGGIEHAVQVKLSGRLLHTSGEWIEAAAFGEGQDRADKAIYKAITGARKYLLASMLNLATTDDPEKDEQVGQAEGNGQQKQQSQPAEPNWSDNESARKAIFVQLRANGQDNDGAKGQISGWLSDLAVDSFDETTADQRRHLWLYLLGEAESPTPQVQEAA